MGSYFIQLQGDKLWRILDDESYARLIPYRPIIQEALGMVHDIITANGDDENCLFEHGKLFTRSHRKSKIRTHGLLGSGIQYYYNDSLRCVRASNAIAFEPTPREKAKK